MPGLPLRSFTQQLREKWPEEARELRLRRVRRYEREQFQLIGKLPDLTPVAKTLKAANEFEALQEAIALVPNLMSGGNSEVRVLPMGRLRQIERAALHEIAKQGTRAQTERYKGSQVKRITSWLEERGLPLQAATLLAAIKETDRHSRQRRGIIEGARILARVAEIPLEVAPELQYQEPAVPLVEAVEDAQIIEAYEELLANSNRPEAWWIVGVIIATGCRGTTTLSMNTKGVKDCGDQILAWDSKKNCQIRTTPTIRGFWGKYHLNWASEGHIVELEGDWLPWDKRPTNEQVYRANNLINDVFTHVKRKVSPESGKILKARVLRSAMIARCLKAGMDEMTVSTLASTGVDQIRARYSRYYRSTSIARAAELL